MKIFSKDKEMFEFSNYSTKSKYYDDSKQLVVGKMKYKTTDVAIKRFFWIKATIIYFWQITMVSIKKQRV